MEYFLDITPIVYNDNMQLFQLGVVRYRLTAEMAGDLGFINGEMRYMIPRTSIYSGTGGNRINVEFALSITCADSPQPESLPEITSV